MKKIYLLLFISNVFWHISFSAEIILTPQNTEIIFDVDEVLIEKMGYGIYQTKLAIGGFLRNPFNAINFISAMFNLKNAFVKNSNGTTTMRDDNGNKVNGLTFQFMYQGIRDPHFTPYVAWFCETIETTRWLIHGTIQIANYLKEKGYSINFATNKDHVSYISTVHGFGDTLTSIPTKVFIAHPGNNAGFLAQIKEFAARPTTPADYKKLAYQSLQAQPTDKIFHAPGRKPELIYFQYVEKIIGPEKNLIFIDDQKPNSDAFNTLQKHTTALRDGINFKNPIQLADELIKIGILSETNDKKLLDDIGYSPLLRVHKPLPKIIT